MRTFLTAVAAALAVGLATASTALADCVDYSPAAAERAGAALERNPPSAAQLGLPSLEGWRLDGPRTTGDPACNGPGPPSRYFYNTSLTYAQVVAALYPNIRRRTSVDGMGRVWFANPVYGSRNAMVLTSGARLEFGLGSNGQIHFIMVEPPAAAQPLTVESQPYSVSDIADWTPWPGGADGPREFVRADGGGGAPATGGQTTADAGTTETRETCPPRSSTGGSQVGSAIGDAVGGSAGRAVGSALGGLLGSRNRGQQTTPANENCPQ